MAKAVSRFTGHSLCFVLAIGVILAWAVSGPLFGFSVTWQLVISIGTTIVTFLMLFLTRNTQNRDTEAMQIKPDERIRVTRDAHNALLDLEELRDKEIDAFRARYLALTQHARASGEMIDDIDRDISRYSLLQSS